MNGAGLVVVSVFLLVGAVFAGDGVKSAAGTAVPKAEKRPLEETLHGVKIVDNYRWLEDGSSPETQKWVEAEMAYTNAVLDPLPGREAIHKRLTELLSIRKASALHRLAENIISTRAAKGCRTSPSFLCGMERMEKIACWSTLNQLAADGTIAARLVPAFPENGRYLVYGTSPSGSEMSTLHIVETKTGKTLPDVIERTRAASIAWLLDNSGFYYTRYPKKGDVPDGQEMYNRHVFYHELAEPIRRPIRRFLARGAIRRTGQP